MALIEIDGIPAYRAEAVGELRGALVLIHEIWGLVPHIQDVAGRYAAQGYLVIAPDLLSGIGITPEIGLEIVRLNSSANDQERSDAQPMMREKMAPTKSPEYAAWAVATLTKVVDYLEAQHGVDGRIGIVGFCFGGTYAYALAAADPRLRAAVPYYGQPPASADLAAIQCPVLALYGGKDERLITAFPEVNRAMLDAGVQFASHIYPDAGHAFFNDTNLTRYDASAAADAWIRTLEFLRSTLVPTPEYVRE